jgi:hypothetical protein
VPAVLSFTVLMAIHTYSKLFTVASISLSLLKGRGMTKPSHVSHIPSPVICHCCLYPPKNDSCQLWSTHLQCCAMSKLVSMLHFISKAYAGVCSSAARVCSRCL